ncbi:hypothetical protein WCT98_20665, partial [Pectobacterium brasiliense]
QGAVQPLPYHPVTEVILQLDVAGRGGDLGQPACGNNGDQLLALFVVFVTLGAILCIRSRGEQVKGTVALVPPKSGVIVNKATKIERYYAVGYACINLS